MKKKNLLFAVLGLGALSVMLPSCIDDNDNSYELRLPTALVTVCPEDDGSFIMRLDDEVRLVPVNMKKSPFDDKEVRALVNYSDVEVQESTLRNVHVNWIDSIRTKLPVESMGELDVEKFGDDPIEIVRDWVTIAEDGYLTLRVRTIWGTRNIRHNINLLTGTNPENPYELEIRHDANGDTDGRWSDALIAFNLNGLPRENGDENKIVLKWKSFTGEKSAEFDIKMRPVDEEIDPAGLLPASAIE